LVADIVGYSRLAGADEEPTLARLRTLRSDLIDPAIAVHHGRVVKRTGDGFISEFRSVVDAVRCAIEVQNGMVERTAGLPTDRRIEFRVGIHLGDVVEEADGDLMGEGVNIAARIEGIAAPGKICVSEDAYRQVRGRLDLAVSDLGPTQLKNIADLTARPKSSTSWKVFWRNRRKGGNRAALAAEDGCERGGLFSSARSSTSRQASSCRWPLAPARELRLRRSGRRERHRYNPPSLTNRTVARLRFKLRRRLLTRKS
jgi:hypothetical protein